MQEGETIQRVQWPGITQLPIYSITNSNEPSFIQIFASTLIAAGCRLPGAARQRSGDPGRRHGPVAVNEAEAVHAGIRDGHPRN